MYETSFPRLAALLFPRSSNPSPYQKRRHIKTKSKRHEIDLERDSASRQDKANQSADNQERVHVPSLRFFFLGCKQQFRFFESWLYQFESPRILARPVPLRPPIAAILRMKALDFIA